MKKPFICFAALTFSLCLWALERPKWITDSSQGCPSSYLCAVGEGTGHMGAEGQARNNLAKFFETKIKSSSSVMTEAESVHNEGGVLQGEVREDYRAQIKEVAEQVLEGVEVLQKYEDKESVFALVGIDRSKATQRLFLELKERDQKIQAFYRDGKINSLYKALKLFREREVIHDRYHFISGKKEGPSVSFEELIKLKRKLQSEAAKIFIKVNEFKGSKELEHLLIKELIDSGYRVVTHKKLKHHYRLEASLKAEKQHLNVKGFVKYKFFLQLTTKNPEGEAIGALQTDAVAIGRSKEQAYERSIEHLLDLVKNHLGDLNMD